MGDIIKIITFMAAAFFCYSLLIETYWRTWQRNRPAAMDQPSVRIAGMLRYIYMYVMQ